MDIQDALKTLANGKSQLEQAIVLVRGKVSPDMMNRMERLRDLSDSLHELLSTYAVLQADVLAVIELLREHPQNQAWRRAAYRAVFSWVEGTLFTMKQFALKAAAAYQVELTSEEVSVLSEHQAQLKETGQVQVRSWYLDTKANMRFAFRALAQCHGQSFKLDTGGQSWEEFVTSYEVRNRLTHPKSLRELEVSDEEAARLVRTYTWFVKQIESVTQICLQAQAGLKQQYDEANRADMDALKRSYVEPAERIVRLERVERVLDELTAQVDEDGRQKAVDAKEQLQPLRQYFVDQMTKK